MFHRCLSVVSLSILLLGYEKQGKKRCKIKRQKKAVAKVEEIWNKNMDAFIYENKSMGNL